MLFRSAAIINNAIASKDEATIKAAIAQAQALIAAATSAAPVTPETQTPDATTQSAPEAQ